MPELLIALACAAVVCGTIAAIALRQQRLFAELADNAAAAGRVREVIATLPIDLRALSPAAGDVSEARDTSLEVRATIASAVTCDTIGGATGRSLILGHSLVGAETYASYLATIAAGDTAWLLDARDTAEHWIPRRITSVSSTTATACGRGAPVASGASFTATVVALDTLAPARPGSVIRVTRPVRYSLYKSSDGSWQVGARDWNTTTLRLNAVQPIAGPLLSPAGRGLVFSYFDSAGAVVANPADPSAGLVLIQISARAQSNAPVRTLGAGTHQGADSLDAAVFLHNRR